MDVYWFSRQMQIYLREVFARQFFAKTSSVPQLALHSNVRVPFAELRTQLRPAIDFPGKRAKCSSLRKAPGWAAR
jgi:hypothetical protein